MGEGGTDCSDQLIHPHRCTRDEGGGGKVRGEGH